MKQTYLIYDLECRAKPEEELLALMPDFEAAANLKDPVKILASIADKKQKWLDDAALEAITGQILCIGIMGDGHKSMISGDEPQILRDFFTLLSDAKESQAGAVQFISYNGHAFDLPYILRRSWLLGVPVPSWIRRGRYWNELFVDVREIWQCGDRQASTGGLDGLARAMGLGGKSGSGKDFGKLWESDREAAIEYCYKDLELTRDIALRMGIIQPQETTDDLPL